MALTTLPYPNMDFVPLDILTADELDQIVANIEAINNATIGTNSISNLAITGAKIADGAVDATKMNLASLQGEADVADGIGWTYLGKTVLTANASSMTFTTATKYDNYKVLAGGCIISGSNTWLDVRMLDGATNINNYHQVQRVAGTTWGSAVNANVNYCVNATGVNAYDGFDADVEIRGAGTAYKKFHSWLGVGLQGFSTNIANGANVNNTQPNTFTIITGGTINAGSWVRVWGSNN